MSLLSKLYVNYMTTATIIIMTTTTMMMMLMMMMTMTTTASYEADQSLILVSWWVFCFSQLPTSSIYVDDLTNQS